MNIANQTSANARADINNALGALVSLSSGTSAPSTTFANMLWYETDTNTLYIRNEANSGWVTIGIINGSAFQAKVELASQSDAQTGTENTKTMTPLRVKESIDHSAPFVNSFTSSELTISAAGSYTLSHSLPSVPSLVKIYFVCKTSEDGYTAGDIIDLSNIASTWTTGTILYVGPIIAMNATQIKIKFGSSAAFLYNNFSTGGGGGITSGGQPTLSNWRLLIKAWV